MSKSPGIIPKELIDRVFEILLKADQPLPSSEVFQRVKESGMLGYSQSRVTNTCIYIKNLGYLSVKWLPDRIKSRQFVNWVVSDIAKQLGKKKVEEGIGYQWGDCKTYRVPVEVAKTMGSVEDLDQYAIKAS